MGFYETMKIYKVAEVKTLLEQTKAEEVYASLTKTKLNEFDFLNLLSPAASRFLPEMARAAESLTLQNFGKVVLLYTPIYISDYCLNECVYCGFNVNNDFKRHKLSLEQLENVAFAISKTGLKHVLILTGESRTHSPPDYISSCVKVLNKYFTSVSIEVYPLDVSEYKELGTAGVDGVTIYQEVYDEYLYNELHISGPKKNYKYRLDSAERAAEAGLRTVGIGALLGLNNFRTEIFYTGLHAQYLQKKFWELEVSVSLPRFRPHVGTFRPMSMVSDRDFVQALVALRLFLPRSGISLSTREHPAFRENLISLGITRLSAGVSTNVGGATYQNKSKPQFDISDTRSVADIKKMLENKGYQPIFVDWR